MIKLILQRNFDLCGTSILSKHKLSLFAASTKYPNCCSVC